MAWKRVLGVGVIVVLVAAAGGYVALSSHAPAVLAPAETAAAAAEAAGQWGAEGATLDGTPDSATPGGTAEERGAYVFTAAGCGSCHTAEEDAPLAGGVAIDSPFGTFYGPNITPHEEAGIGGWSRDDLARALRQGISPGGSVYYPAFPYTSYTGMSDRDIDDLWAYLRTVEPSDTPSTPHDLRFPFSWRFLLNGWQLFYMAEGRPAIAEDAPDAWRRGAYLVEALGHCGQCHSPRTALGGVDWSAPFTGSDRAPPITPEALAGWSLGDLTFMFEIGMLPDGDFVGSEMADVQAGLAALTAADRQAIAAYLLGGSVPAE